MTTEECDCECHIPGNYEMKCWCSCSRGLDGQSYPLNSRNSMKDDCIFCKIANGKIPVEILHENINAVLISDKNPIAPNHLLVIPKKHWANLGELQWEGPLDTMAIIGEMFDLVDKYVSSTTLGDEGYRVVINAGDHAGQTVKHLHLHLLGGSLLKNDFGA